MVARPQAHLAHRAPADRRGCRGGDLARGPARRSRLRARAHQPAAAGPAYGELAGFPQAEVEQDLTEWDYGDYEGITTVEIRETVPGWSVWTHPTPGGETADQVSARLDRVVARAREHGGRVLLFGHGHALRALAARWIGRPVDEGRFWRLDTATVSVLGYERDTPVILRWNA